jgi:uncharacterized membrane protein
MGIGSWPEVLIILIGLVVAFSIVMMLPWFFIYKKAGFHPAMGCLMFLPLINIVMMFVLAFIEWPIERELRNQRVPPAQTS